MIRTLQAEATRLQAIMRLAARDIDEMCNEKDMEQWKERTSSITTGTGD